MMTYESEEDHGKEPAFLRKTKGEGRQDKGWKMLHKAQNSKRSEHPFDIRDLRNHVQAGNPFPIPTEPSVDWFDQQPVTEL